MSNQAEIQALSDDYSKLQDELSTLVQARQKLDSQFTENKGVQKEFSKLDDNAAIYKLVGPVLLKQDSSEAKSTVDSRLEYIEKEVKRVETSIKDIQEKSDAKRMEIMQIQSQMQQHAPAA